MFRLEVSKDKIQHKICDWFLTLCCLIMMEGLGMWGYSSSSGLQSKSSSPSSELWETLWLSAGDSKQKSSSVSCRWRMEPEMVPFTFLVLVEEVEIQLTVLWGSPFCWSCMLLGRASGWDVTGATGFPWLSLLWLEMFGSWAVAWSVLTSLGLPKQWPREEQGSPCMLRDLNITTRESKINPNCTDIRWIRGLMVSRAISSHLCVSSNSIVEWEY